MFVIGVCGGTGSGKTTFVKNIMSRFKDNQVACLSQDSYYKDTSNLSFENKCFVNFDHPNALDFDLLIQNVIDLKRGNAVKQPIYSFTEHNRTKESEQIAPKKVIFVEGILIFSNLKLLELFDLKLFIDVDEEVRIQRRINRDVLERGRSKEEVLERYKTNGKPMHEKFIEPTKKYADFIISNEPFNQEAIDTMCNLIKQKI